jgi:hypothetical protein
MLSFLRRKPEQSAVPVCPDHKVEMRIRGKLGRPSRFTDQTEEEYTLIFYCPEAKCNQTAMRVQTRSQIPVPGEPPRRPDFARVGDRKPTSDR